MLRLVLFLCIVGALSGQAPKRPEIKVSNTTPRANETVVLEVVGIPQGPEKIYWLNESGDGVFPSSNVGQKVEFKPTKPGDVVIIICQLLGTVTDRIQAPKLTVAQESPAAPLSARAAPQTAPPLLSPQVENLPTAPNFPIAGIANDPSKELVVPSGFMGDALPENGHGASRLTGSADCFFQNAGCYSIVYDMSRNDLAKGFTAYAWQVLPQERDYNFGEFSGVDLSQLGFRSLRLSARAAPGSAIDSPRVEFKSGGNIEAKFAARHPHSYTVSTGPIPLSTRWTDVCLDLSRADLHDVVSPLTVVISSALNPPARVAVSIDGAGFSREPCPRR